MTTYRAHFPRMPRTLTRELAVQVIAQHGWKPNDPTASGGDPGSCFDAMMGVHDTYDTAEVFRWLGYDDMPED